ncbi:MAG: aspartate dehydrogenase domain-containing protein, partial [Pseudomonadota bacterium]
GSPAEAAIDLGGLREATTFFCGTGREAALAYPKNANVVAALALAGAGFDRMRVELVADPQATANQHSYRVDAPDCQYSMAIEAKGSAANARTSVTTVLSILQEISAYEVRP